MNAPEIRRRQLQLTAGEPTTSFVSTVDLAQAIGDLATEETGAANSTRGKDHRRHLARREAFMEALNLVLPA